MFTMVAKGRPEFVSHFLVQYLLFRNKGQFMAVLFPSNFYFYSHRKANEIDWLGVELLILFVNLVYLHGHVFFCRSLFSNAEARVRSFIGLWACLLLVSITARGRERYARWEKRAVHCEYSYVLNIDSSSSTKKSQNKSYMMHYRCGA